MYIHKSRTTAYSVVSNFTPCITFNNGFIYKIVARQSRLNGNYFNGALSTFAELQMNQMNYLLPTLSRLEHNSGSQNILLNRIYLHTLNSSFYPSNTKFF